MNYPTPGSLCTRGAGMRLHDVLADVARLPGKTPAVCRKAYVHPAVLNLAVRLADERARATFRNAAWAKPVRARRGLRVAEQRFLALLRRSGGAPPDG